VKPRTDFSTVKPDEVWISGELARKESFNVDGSFNSNAWSTLDNSLWFVYAPKEGAPIRLVFKGLDLEIETTAPGCWSCFVYNKYLPLEYRLDDLPQGQLLEALYQRVLSDRESSYQGD